MSYVLYFLLLLFNLKVINLWIRPVYDSQSQYMLLRFVKGPDANSVLVHGEGECDGLMSIQ